MFYAENPESRLRFGDIIKGYVGITPVINSLNADFRNSDFNIEISYPNFFVVLSPCCSIEKSLLMIAPLEQVIGTFFRNPYFEKDLTVINKKMNAEQSIIPAIWGTLPPEEKERRLSEGAQFAFAELFVYEKNDLLPAYTIHMKDVTNIETNYYMVDFRKTFSVKCDLIAKNVEFALKYLQLSVKSRNDLRNKIGGFESVKLTV
ncbi:MAG: hypothetical protein PHH14_02235 [Candidatus Margulisbacteria bacterium]|nr:hypothetical protein [Candidatus Margulisiibacteriota bacterium]